MSSEILAPIYPGQRPFHIIEAQQFTREWMEEDLFPLAKSMENVADFGGGSSLRMKRVRLVFYESSTRTQESFESAIELLGGTYGTTTNAGEFSSAAKGEELDDSAKVRNKYRYHCIVLRHNKEGGALETASVSKIPVINAGDGEGQHPTQALLDVYTIHEQLGTLQGLEVAIIGDLLRGRTTHSLAYLLAKFPGTKLHFVSPPEVRMKQEIKDYLDRHNVPHLDYQDIRDVLPRVDIAYVTRPQLERPLQGITSSIDFRGCVVNLEALSLMQPHAKVLHPMPRTFELPKEVDEDLRVVIFRQVENGLFIRMALFQMILGNGNR